MAAIFRRPGDPTTRRPWRVKTCSQVSHAIDRVLLRHFPPEVLAHREWGYPGHPHHYAWCAGTLTFSVLFPGPVFDQFVDELHRVAPYIERLSAIQRCEHEACEVLGLNANGRPIAPRYGRFFTLVFNHNIRVYDDAGQCLLA